MPERTPAIIRYLLIITSSITLLSALMNPLFTDWIQILGPQELFSLSWSGILHGYIWQPITHLFIQSTKGLGINFFYLLTLCLNMFFLWFLGSNIQEKFGTRHFLNLYFFSGILAGIAALLMMGMTGQYQYLAGPTASLLALFTVWTMLFSDLELLAFMLFPLQAKWIFALFVGATVIIHLSHFDLVHLTWNVAGVLFGYCYGIYLGLSSPYLQMQNIDKLVDRWLMKWKNKFQKNTGSKILDIKTGQPLIDDATFVDMMLMKIAKYGESALTTSERKRMDQISTRKKK